MSDIQHQTDLEQAKAKLQEVQESKEARKDPRSNDQMLPAPRKQEQKEESIRPVEKKPLKKKFSQKLKEAMFSDDIGNGGVTEYVFFKILIPSVKRVLSDMANTAINMALGLDPKTRTVGSNTHVANASVYRDRNYYRNDGSGGYNRREAISEIEWDEETAHDIYNQMSDLIDRFGECTIADVYSIMCLGERIRTTDRNWGWTSMRNIDVVPVDVRRERWVVDVPSAKALH